MTNKKYLMFDFGASNGRAVVASLNSKKFSIDEVHRFENRPVRIRGTLYWDILRLYSELKIGIQKSLQEYLKIRSIGIDAWGADFGLIDKSGNLISNPIHYRDKQKALDSKELLKQISEEELFNLTGYLVDPIFDLFQLYSLKLNNSLILKNAHNYLSITDLFNYFLSGNITSEHTRASTTILYDQVKKQWSKKILDKIELNHELFSQPIMPGSAIGNIQKSVCYELDIKPVRVIAPATHDTASAIAGIPVRDTNVSWAFLSMGSWFCMGKETDFPFINNRVLKSGFANEAGIDGTNLLFKNINGLWVIQQCMDLWNQENKLSWEDIQALTLKSKSFKSFIDPDHNHFVRSHSNMPETIRKYCRQNGSIEPNTIGGISRCVYESLVLKFTNNLKILENITNTKLELLHIVGGGTKNELLCQWISDSTGVQVCAGPTETTSIGNLLMQLKVDKEINNLKEGRELTLNSSKLIYYEPKNTHLWGEAYQEYIKLIDNKK